MRQTCSDTVQALLGVAYTLVAAFAVSDVDIFLAAWADTVVQVEYTREFAVLLPFVVCASDFVPLSVQARRPWFLRLSMPLQVLLRQPFSLAL